MVLPWSCTRMEQRRRRLRGSVGVGGAPFAVAALAAYPWYATRRAAAQDRHPHLAPSSLARSALANSRKKLSVVAASSSADADALELGHLGRGMGDEGGLVGLAALRHRREVGRVGLDQQPVERDVAHDGAQGLGRLEGDDARDRDVHAERQRPVRHLGARAEAMDQAGEGALGVFLLEDVAGLAVGVAGMDDQRQAGLARRRDMGAEALGLLGARAVLVVEVEPGLADADDLGMARGLDQAVGRALPLLLGLVRMDADRAPDIAVALGDGAHLVELVEPGADGQHAGHAGGAGARQHAGLVARELGEVEMAVAVDQHQLAAPLSPLGPARRSAGTRPAAPAAPCRTRSSLSKRGERPLVRRHGELVEDLARRVRHEGLHQQGHPPDGLGQHPQHRVAPRRIGLGAAPTAPARRHSGWRRRSLPRSRSARDGRPARRARARTVGQQALGAVEQRRVGLDERALGAAPCRRSSWRRSTARAGRDCRRRWRGRRSGGRPGRAAAEVAVVAERHLAQQEVAHRVEAVCRDQLDRVDRRCRATSTSSGPRWSTSRARTRAAAAPGRPPSGRPASRRSGSG